MELYFSPLACSLATRMALYEIGADATFTPVDLKAKRVGDGSDFLEINPMGQVPVLKCDDGALLTQNSVILHYVADQHPASALGLGSAERRRAIARWLAFTSSEIHMLVFTPLLSPNSNEGAKAFAREMAKPRLDFLNRTLEGRETLVDGLSVADLYLSTVLNWSRAPGTGIDLANWPNVLSYMSGIHARPNIARALQEEFALYAKAA